MIRVNHITYISYRKFQSKSYMTEHTFRISSRDDDITVTGHNQQQELVKVTRASQRKIGSKIQTQTKWENKFTPIRALECNLHNYKIMIKEHSVNKPKFDTQRFNYKT